MKKRNLLIVLLSMAVFASCKKDSILENFTPANAENGYLSSNELKIEFARTLAKAMGDANVRALLKEEALKQFDNDYDVLFSLVKDREVLPGVSLASYLNSLTTTNISFGSLSEIAPMLTIFVPELKEFSPAKWNTNNEIPAVAVVKNDYDEKTNDHLIAFDALGRELQLESHKQPGFPVIVVKENERIAPIQHNARLTKVEASNFVFSNNTVDFYFRGDSFNKKKNVAVSNETIIANLDIRLKDAYNLNAASQRDYVYYNILNPTDQGVVKNDYAEYLRSFAVTLSSFAYVTDDWTEGHLEFQMDVLFFNGASALNKISKVFSFNTSDLISADHNVSIAQSMNLMIATWDMQKCGDTWKYVVNEIDPGQVVTTNHTSSSKFGANFEVSGIQIFKIGLGFGGSFETNSSNSTTIQTTTGSDFCGEAVINWLSPVITSHTDISGIGGGRKYNVASSWTGSVLLVVAPQKIQ